MALSSTNTIAAPETAPPSVVEPHQRQQRAQATNHCGAYRHGANLTWQAYTQQMQRLEEGFSLPRLQTLVNSVEAETIRALYDVFSNVDDPATQVYYTSFSALGNRNTQDGGEGFRVVWQRTVNGRMTSVITFWKYNGRGGFELVGGADSLRVRTEIEPPRDPGLRQGGFAALSYQVNLNAGRVASVRGGVYQSANGEQARTTPALTSHSNALSCRICHSTFRNRAIADHYFNIPTREGSSQANILVDEARLPSTRAVQHFLDSVVESNPMVNRPALSRMFQTPRRTFVPPGILEAVNSRCRELSGQ